MRIARLAVRRFRKLCEGIEIEGFKPGLTVIVGDNEEGKSTLLKALQSAFFDRHNLTGKLIDEMMPFGSSVRPEIEVDFELAGESYRLEKGFCHEPSALLKRNGGERIWQNDSAEETLRELLSFTPPGRGAAKEEHRGLAGLLWVEQGRAFEPLQLNEDSRTALHEAIEGEVGQVLGGDRGRVLLTAAEQRTRHYFTPTGRERDTLKSPRKRVKDLQDECDKLKSDVEDYDEKVEDLEKLQGRLAQYQRDNRLGSAETDVERAHKAVRQIEGLENDIKTAKAEADSAATLAESATGERTLREKMVKSVEQKENEIENKRPELQESEIKRDVAQENYDTAQNSLEKRSAQLEAVRKAHRETQRQLERAQRAAALNDLEKRLQDAESLSSQIEKEREILAGIEIDDRALVRLRTLSGEVHKSKAALNAIATSLIFAPDGDNAVVLDGLPVDTEKPLKITDRTTVRLEGFGSLEILPGGEDIADLREELSRLENDLREELQSVGMETVEDAEKEHRHKQERTSKVERLQGELQGVAGGKLDKLRMTVDEQRGELAGLTVEADGTPPSVERAREAESAMRTRHDEAQEAASEAEQTRNSAKTQYDQLKGRCIKTKAEFDHEAKTLAAERTALEEARQDRTDERLQELADETKQEAERRNKKREDLISKLEAQSPDSVRSEQERAQKAFDRLKKTIEADNRESLILTTELRTLGQKGLAEELERKDGELASSSRELQRIELDAKAWKLLLTSLQEAESEAKAKFLTPVKDRLEPYLRLLFPDASLQLDGDDLEIVGIHRNGIQEPFLSLSIGMREQIAVLTRLALADLLREKGKPVALVLDDPLVNSDPKRFKRMRHALHRAAENVQIIILTCHEDRYKTLDASMIHLSDCPAW